MRHPKNKHALKNNLIYGTHAVAAALEHGRVTTLWHTQDLPENWHKWLGGLALREADKRQLDDKCKAAGQGHAVHQGVVAEVKALPALGLEDAMHHNTLLALDQVTDPHNLGAILRSADAFGCGAVLVPKAHAVDVTAVAAKAAVGAAESIPVIPVNLAQALEKLKKEGFWTIGLDGQANQSLSDISKTEKTCLVMGSEGAGLRPLVAKNCDYLAKLPMTGTVESLNVSVATAIALYELVRGKYD